MRVASFLPSTPVEQLGEAIAMLAQRLHAATYELLVMLRQFDAQAGWNTGSLSCAHWLHWRTGIDLGAAREKVRVAKALEARPRLSGAIQRGEISYAKVRAISRVATADTEERLLHLAYHATAARVERVVRAWRRCDRLEETRDTERQHLGRTASVWVDDDGMVMLRARLTPELGAVVQRALEAASDRLYQESREAVRVSAETSRRLACDASMVIMREGPDGSTLDVERKTRPIPAAIRRALNARDERCRFPGCTARRCDAHHVTHWADGGRTSLENLLLLCRRHHRLVHEGGLRVERGAGGEVSFVGPDGRRRKQVPPRPLRGLPPLVDPESAGWLPSWEGTRFNAGYVLDVLRPQPAEGGQSSRLGEQPN